MANSRRRTQTKTKPSFNAWKQFLLGFFVLFSAMTFSSLYLFKTASLPFSKAKEQAVEVARKYTGLQEVSGVSIYNGKETYYHVSGQNATGEDLFVLVPEKSANIFVYRPTEGISREEAEARALENGAQDIERTVLGYTDQHAIWEVKAGTAYYVIDFKTGELLQKEGL